MNVLSSLLLYHSIIFGGPPPYTVDVRANSNKGATLWTETPRVVPYFTVENFIAVRNLDILRFVDSLRRSTRTSSIEDSIGDCSFYKI